MAGQPYLRAAVNGLASVHDDVAQGVVAVQLHRVELPQFDGVGVPYGGHSRAHVEPETTEVEMRKKLPIRLFQESFVTSDLNSKRPPTSPREMKSAPVVLFWPL